MLESMRQNLKSLQIFLWLVIVAFIASVFFVWGGGGKNGGDQNAAAWVNGKAISFASFENSYRNIYNFYKQIYGDRLTEEVTRQVEQSAINQLIRKALLAQEAQRYNLRISDAELVKEIRSIPQFQTDNRFDPALYKRLLAGVRLTPQEFEEQVMEDLLVQKMDHLIKQTVRISDQEVLEEYKHRNEKVQIEGIFIASEQFKETVEVPDEEIITYYDTHKETFTTPERRKIQYIHFDPQQITDEVDPPTEEEIRKYYEENEAEFNKGKEVKARHILLRLDADADEETQAAVKKKAEEILQQLKDGADFAEMAKQHSEDPGSAANGGDLGFFTKGMMVPEFENAAFATEPGAISDLVQTSYGYHILKVEETREETDPYGKAKPIITDRLKLEQAKELTVKRAEEAYQKLRETEDLQQIANNAGVEMQVSQFFARGEPIDDKTMAIPQLQETAFSLSADEKFSEPLETSLGHYLVEFLEVKEPYIPQLQDIAENVTDAVRQEKAEELARAEAQKLEEELKNGTTWEELIEQYSLETFSPQPFSRTQYYITEFGEKSADAIKIAFSLKENETSSVLELPQKYCLFRLVEKIGIDEEKLQEEKETLKQQLLQQKQNTVFQEFVEELKQQADIRISEYLAG